MVHFTNAPPAADGERALPIKRTPPTGRLKACITSDDLIGCNTHFFGGHTVPCEGNDCPVCGKGIPWRWHGYVAAINAGNRGHFIFEFTAQAADTLKEYHALNGTLRGCIITAERMHHRANGRVILTCSPGDLAALNLPKEPDIIACLSIIWHLPKDVAEGNGQLKDKPAFTFDKTRKTVAEQLIDAGKRN